MTCFGPTDIAEPAMSAASSMAVSPGACSSFGGDSASISGASLCMPAESFSLSICKPLSLLRLLSVESTESGTDGVEKADDEDVLKIMRGCCCSVAFVETDATESRLSTCDDILTSVEARSLSILDVCTVSCSSFWYTTTGTTGTGAAFLVDVAPAACILARNLPCLELDAASTLLWFADEAAEAGEVYEADAPFAAACRLVVLISTVATFLIIIDVPPFWNSVKVVAMFLR